MNEIEIGRGKRGRRAYSFDDIAVVPSSHARPRGGLGRVADRRVSLRSAGDRSPDGFGHVAPVGGAFGQHGGLPVLDLEGLWTRYPDPQPCSTRSPRWRRSARRRGCRRSIARIQPELIVERLRQVRDAGVTVAGALSPQRTQQFWRTVVDAGVDMFVIRGTTVSAEHVSGRAEPLNLKRFIYELDVPVIVGGVASYTPHFT